MGKLSLLVVLLSVSLASAAVLEDFEGAYAGAGVLVADPEDAGNTVLHLSSVPGTDNAEVFQIAAPDTTGIVTMRIFDFGANDVKVDTRFGPRWGVRGDAGLETACVNIHYKEWISGYKGYTANAAQGVTFTPTATISSPHWYMGTQGRYVKALDDLSTTEVDESQGAWATWTFEVTAGVITASAAANDVVDENGVYSSGPVTASGDLPGTVGNLSSIFVSSGTDAALPEGHLKFVGVLVDDITFAPIPEPATMSILALGGLAMLRRRRS